MARPSDRRCSKTHAPKTSWLQPGVLLPQHMISGSQRCRPAGHDTVVMSTGDELKIYRNCADCDGRDGGCKTCGKSGTMFAGDTRDRPARAPVTPMDAPRHEKPKGK